MAPSLLALLDDITTLLDDVAALSKVAASKTTGVIGDDLALNAEQVTGLRANRELPVVWAVAKGSFANKLILVPAALLISAFVPAAILPLLMVGGVFLVYEGFEKVAHKLSAPSEAEVERRAKRVEALADPGIDLVALEKQRIKGAIRTDFILSAEIIVIALGTMTAAAMSRQIVALSAVAIGVTVVVYGLVAAIVKLDDAGLLLTESAVKAGGASWKGTLGAGILVAAPFLMKTLSIVGTAAMFSVGGSIIVHGIHALEHHVTDLAAMIVSGGLAATLVKMMLEAIVGVIVGGIVVGVVTAGKKLTGGSPSAAEAH